MTLTTIALLLIIIALILVIWADYIQYKHDRNQLTEYHAENIELRKENTDLTNMVYTLRLQLHDIRVEEQVKLIKEEE